MSRLPSTLDGISGGVGLDRWRPLMVTCNAMRCLRPDRYVSEDVFCCPFSIVSMGTITTTKHHVLLLTYKSPTSCPPFHSCLLLLHHSLNSNF